MRSETAQKIVESAKAAVADAIEEHRRAGRAIVVLRDGQVTWIQPEDIPVREKVRPNSGVPSPKELCKL